MSVFLGPDPDMLLRAAQTIPNTGFLRYIGVMGADTLILTTPDVRREIFSSQSYAFEKPANVRRRFRTVTGDGLVVAEGEEHKVCHQHEGATNLAMAC